MPSWRDEFFPREHVTADDLWVSNQDEPEGGHYRTLKLKVKSAVPKEVNQQGGGKKKKLVLYFERAKKYLILNAGMCEAMEDITGVKDDYRRWAGAEVEIYVTNQKGPRRDGGRGQETYKVPRIRKVGSPARVEPEPTQDEEPEFGQAPFIEEEPDDERIGEL
jgi:hypothetical protein